MFYRRLFVLSLFIAATASLACARDLALVSNKANALSTITLPELVKLCKAETSRWPDGKPVTFVMRAPSEPEMKMLLEKVYGLAEPEVKDLITTANHGRMNHPAILIANSDEDLVN